jgi:hypothetical protein
VEIDQLVVGDDRRSLGAEDPDAGIQPGIGSRRPVDDPQGAAGEAGHGHRGVFDLDPLMRQAGGVGEHLGGNAQHGDQQVDGVDGLVHDRPATVHGPGAAPAAGVVVRLPPPPGRGGDPGGQASEVAGLDGRHDLLGGGVEAVLGHDGDLLPRGPLSRDDAVGGFKGDVDGLFDHDVLAGGEGSHGLVRVESGGGADADRLDLRTGQRGGVVGRIARGMGLA